jgi:hypothetical protein
MQNNRNERKMFCDKITDELVYITICPLMYGSKSETKYCVHWFLHTVLSGITKSLLLNTTV